MTDEIIERLQGKIEIMNKSLLEYDAQNVKLSKLWEAERKRSAKLVAAIRRLRFASDNAEIGERILQALAEWQAGIN